MGHITRFHVATCTFLLTSCAAVNGMLAQPASGSGSGSSAGTSAGSAPASTQPDASGVSPKERWWRQVQMDSANGQGDWAKGYGDDGHMQRSHQRVVENCGHDIQVTFDWKTFDMAHWLDAQKKAHYGDDMPAAYCTYNTIYELGSACAADSAIKPYQREALKQIKTLTCHYRPCKQMPNGPNSAPDRQEVGTLSLYELTNGGTNLDETYCESEYNASEAVNAWIKSI